MSIARAAKPDLILMDLGLPGIDGWDATAQLKMDRDTQHIPIIVLSAHAMTNDRHQALAAGGDDFDTKPVQFHRLIEKMETLLARRPADDPEEPRSSWSTTTRPTGTPSRDVCA